MSNAQLDDTDLFPRANRNPTLAEEAAVKQILAEEEEVLARLNVSIEKYKKNLDLAQKNVSLFKERMAQAKARQSLAVQLRDDLRGGLENMQRINTLEEAGVVTDTEADEDTVHHKQELQAILQSRKVIVQGITKQIEDAESSIMRQTKALAIVRGEFQGSLSVEGISIQTLRSAMRQRKQLLLSIQSKKNVLRPIWRLPHEIWSQIFRETTHRPLSRAKYIAPSEEAWRQPFTLSAVCYQWRSICRADPRLWQDPVVIVDDENHPTESDFETHLALTAGVLETLTIFARGLSEPISSHSILKQLSSIKALNVLIADIWGSTCTNTLLTFDSPMPALRELSIDMQEDHDFPGLFATIHQSGTNLRKLHFVGDMNPGESSPTPDTRTTLANLQEISMSCQNLLQYFVPNFMCPSLQKISFPTPEMPQETNWDLFFAQGSPATTINEVDIFSMDCDVVQNILPFLDKLRNLNTLTLQEDSVEPVLQAKISVMTDAQSGEGYSLLCFRTLETLRVKSYTGTGEVVLQYVEALQGLQGNDANQDSIQDCLKAIVFEDCPDITESVKSDSLHVWRVARTPRSMDKVERHNRFPSIFDISGSTFMDNYRYLVQGDPSAVNQPDSTRKAQTWIFIFAMPNVQLDDNDLFPRSNRNPTPASEAMVKQLLAKEEESLAHLDKFIEECNETLDLARKNITSSKERMRKAKMRQVVAVQLRDALRNGLESIRGMDIMGEETNSGTQITEEKDEDDDTINYSRELQNLLQPREITILGILKQIEDAESLIARQAETFSIAYEEFQSSLFVERISQVTLGSTASQRLQAVTSIQSKKDAIRPICRLPREILNQIFRETAYQPLRKAEYIKWRRVPNTWRQPFILSSVCYQWRSVCRADPQLWKDPIIIVENDENGSLPDLQTHCTLTGGILDTLTIVAHNAPSFDSPMQALEELTIDLLWYHRFPRLIAVIHESGTKLCKFHFTGHLGPYRANSTANPGTTLASLREISMSCKNLLEWFLPNFVCPSLRKISFLSSEMPEETDWDPFFSGGNLATTIEDVDIAPMSWSSVPNIILLFLDKLRNLNTLTLQDASVEPIKAIHFSAFRLSRL
ncbi:hypothetical protein M408DRAFT_317549 [Serendipita vermifera MAFF 305830]|uniref:F-box domain-containing protein n=1 Tax=Serendipita vermifera MAFF 305830 TaxID=933852 RepID=A0A0C3AZ66_SERVB|nr:hypothetical protein M408DRAFT_317549 [Serendipita vermifera MAFF 305830]